MFQPFLLYIIDGINWDTKKQHCAVEKKKKIKMSLFSEGLYMNASLLLSVSVFLSTASVTEATMTSSLKPTWPTWKICGVGLSGFSFVFFLWFVCYWISMLN